MRLRTFQFIARSVWTALALVVAWNLATILQTCETLYPQIGLFSFPLVASVFIVLGILLQRNLKERFVAVEDLAGELRNVENRRKRALRDARRAEKAGKTALAAAIYEQQGMLDKALELAHDSGDKAALARLLLRQGLYRRARALFLQLQDYETAGSTSALMGEIAAARAYYRQAAESAKGQAPESKEADLWDHAGERALAAGLFEKAADFVRAAECFRLAGDKESAARLERQAKAANAIKQKGRAGSAEFRDRALEVERTKAGLQARELEAKGDFLGAGLLFRKAGNMLEAATAFQRFEEWERAADGYEKAGLKDRAELARMHLEPQPVTPSRRPTTTVATAAEALPPPSAVLARASLFEPLVRTRPVPIYLGASGLPDVSPEVRREVCKRVRRGNFLEAAEFAKAAGDWVMAAGYYEHAGNYLAAADVYRQIGDFAAAAFCLERADRPRDAALMSLAIGQNEQAVKTLLNAMEKGADLRQNGLLLVDMLVRWGKFAPALALLQQKIFPEGPDEENAEILYSFACRLEEAKAWKEAHLLYQQLLAAGALSDDLNLRAARVAEHFAYWEALDTEKSPETKPPLTDGIDLLLLAGLQEIAESTSLRRTPAGKDASPPVFRFLSSGAVASGPQARGTRDDKETAGSSVLALSLFGHCVGEAAPSFRFDAVGNLVEEGAHDADLSIEQADPFAPRSRYEVRGEIGRGGLGVVFEAVDHALGRTVALKRLQEEFVNPERLEQFLVDTRAIALLAHPNVVSILDVGLMDLDHYIAMEYVEGGSLADLIRRERVLSFQEALRLLIEIGRGLQAAHEAGVVHRDVKPANVLLTKARGAKIADFGLARVRKMAKMGEKAGLDIPGTLGFLAPEQLLDAESHPAADVYSLGITFFAMLVGKAPFEAAGKTRVAEIVEFQQSGEVIPIKRFRPNVPDSIEQLYRYCTAADREERYPSIEAFLPAVAKMCAAM